MTVTKTTSTYNLKNDLDFSYYPNPTQGELNIEVVNDKSQSYTIRVSDLLGKEIVKESYKGSTYKIRAKTLLPGIYFINLEEEDGKRGHGKVVVE